MLEQQGIAELDHDMHRYLGLDAVTGAHRDHRRGAVRSTVRVAIPADVRAVCAGPRTAPAPAAPDRTPADRTTPDRTPGRAPADRTPASPGVPDVPGGRMAAATALPPFARHGAEALVRFVRAHLDGLLDLTAVVVSLANVVLLLPVIGSTAGIAASAAAALLVGLRRRYPFLVAVLAVGALFVGVAQLAAMIALTTLVRRRRWHWQVLVTAAGLWTARFLLRIADDRAGFSAAHHYWSGAVWGGLIVAAPILVGLLLAAHSDLRAKVRELASAQVAVDSLAVESARADERARLAREMHDVVSHQVTLIAVQAGALQVAEDGNRAEIAATIRGLCTKTLNELRGLVGMLRAAPEARRSMATTDKSLDEVITLASQAGAEVELAADLPRADVSGRVATAAFRTVQEAITNAHKHAPGAGVQVSISAEGGELEVRVVNEAAGDATPVDLPSGGHGLRGLRERVDDIGGRFSARPTASGGFAVSATYPIGTPA